MVNGTITMITDKLGEKKHEEIIGKAISYDRQYIEEGMCAFLVYTEKGTEFEGKHCRTSTVQSIEEDSYGLTLYTRNSIFYIEKSVDKGSDM